MTEESNDTNEQTEAGHVHGPDCNHAQEKLMPITRLGLKVGRNDPCSCGSQKKFKKCCGK